MAGKIRFNKAVRLRVQVIDNTLTISAEPGKGEPDEEAALEAMGHIEHFMARAASMTRVMKRNTSHGNHVDSIVLDNHCSDCGAKK